MVQTSSGKLENPSESMHTKKKQKLGCPFREFIVLTNQLKQRKDMLWQKNLLQKITLMWIAFRITKESFVLYLEKNATENTSGYPYVVVK